VISHSKNVIFITCILGCTFLFHICSLFSLIQVAEIRSAAKFYALLLYKFSNSYLVVVYSIFNLLKNYLKDINQIIKIIKNKTTRALNSTTFVLEFNEMQETNGNDFLRETAIASVVNTGTLAPATALMLLEQAISSSPAGTNGVIHMTRDVASILGSRIIYLPADGGKTGKAMTRLGTDVVIGSGYTGAGRLGDANTAASASNKWMFATGPVDVHLSKIEIVNENLGQGATVSTNTNDLTVRAVRSAAVYFDPAIFYTIRLALPTT
jgi:hypothetical protein